MAAGAEDGERSLKDTPTWAVAVVTAVFVIISVVIELAIHKLGAWFKKRNKKAMLEALEKIKSELMLLGFISLMITVGTRTISEICIPEHYGSIMLPCVKEKSTKQVKDDAPPSAKNDRRLLWEVDDQFPWRRSLAAAAGGSDHCSKHGKVPLISQSGVHQLHIFIFVLAVFHVLYSILTIFLAKAKMKKWKSWEQETTSLEYQFSNDPSRFRLTHQTSFVRRHSGISRTPGLRWIVAFFRQFFHSVTKIDYLTMRHGFINAHFAPGSKFDFHKYIKRSMEDDFKVVVGISIPLWICCIVFQLSNVYGTYALSLVSFIPLVILLVVGTKLEIIIMEMAQEIQDKTTVVKGAPVVEPSNKYFWFNRPNFILLLIHFTLFQNAFQMAYFLWTWYEFSLKSCFHERLVEVLVRVCLGVVLQFLCSYITFPLYALITQMGSHMKKAIFEEQTAKALRNWQKAARERRKHRGGSTVGPGESPSRMSFMSGDNTPSRGSSPLHLLHKYKNNSSTPDLENVMNSPQSYHSETELSENEGTMAVAHAPAAVAPRRPEDSDKRGEICLSDFSFSRS